jgi:GTP cyclohydrolase I
MGIKQKENMKQDKKIAAAAKKYAEFMNIILPGCDTDPNSVDTPTRVAKAFINELFKSMHYEDELKITAFDNVDAYDGIVLQSNIPVKSMCAHHHQNISGIAHVAYIPKKDGKIIGLSKLNRIVEWFARRPQVQENLCMQIHDFVNQVCTNNNGVAVVIKAKHACCSHRGVNHDSDMQTAKLSGGFINDDRVRNELYQLIDYATKR